MTVCFHHGSAAFSAACSAFGLLGGTCSVRSGPAARQRPIVTRGKIDFARFNTIDLPDSATPRLRCSRLCVLVNLQLLRQLKFVLLLLRPAHLAIGLSEQMVRHGVIGIHGDGAL